VSLSRTPWESDYAAYFAARAPALRRLAYALSGDWHTAEDLVQVTFVKLYRHWNRIRPESLDAYVRRILVNTFHSLRRDTRREMVVAEPPDGATAPGRDPHERIDLGRALALLPPRQRAMVVLRHLEDMSVADVADLLGVAEGTVKSQTSRAVESLRRVLELPGPVVVEQGVEE
jgi:RNA polymerase sigma-70 factor (sigma-E family)